MSDDTAKDKPKKDRNILLESTGQLLSAFMRVTPQGIAMRGTLDPTTSDRTRMALNETIKDNISMGYELVRRVLTDKHESNRDAAGFDEWWRKNVTQNIGLGEAEFRMGVGWKIPATKEGGQPIKYNGVPVSKEMEGTEIKAKDAIFVKDKKGNVEIIDHKDRRFEDIAYPYILGSLLNPNIAGKAVAALKAVEKAPKAVQFVTNAADMLGKIGSGAVAATMSTHVARDLYSGIVLKPESIREIAGLIEDPKRLQADYLRTRLNTVYEQYSFLNGPKSEQYFVAELKDKESPFDRLQDLSRGVARNVFESQNPFDRIKDLTKKSPHYRDQVDIKDAKQLIRADVHFQRAYLQLGLKAVNGTTLSNEEVLALRFAMNIARSDTAGAILGATPLKGGNIIFTPDEQKETIRLFVKRMSQDCAMEKAEKESKLKNLSEDEIQNNVQIAKASILTQPLDQKELKAYLKAKFDEVDATIKATEKDQLRKFESQKAAAQVVAFTAF